MKKLIAGVLIFFMILSLAGCGVKENLEKKAGEALTEKMIEGAGGGDVDIEGSTVTIKGENGEELVVGDSEWPKSELAKSVPEFKEGKITGVLDSEDSVFISLESVKKSDADAYLEKIKVDFTQEPLETTDDEGGFNYGAKNADGINVTILYSGENLTITVGKAAE
ncbi:MAG TPA: DUF6591 domain-containing protein [Clostridia bacterium]|nr:DUF6591 domain-containing protein [Clostridia bacterium]